MPFCVFWEIPECPLRQTSVRHSLQIIIGGVILHVLNCPKHIRRSTLQSYKLHSTWAANNIHVCIESYIPRLRRFAASLRVLGSPSATKFVCREDGTTFCAARAMGAVITNHYFQWNLNVNPGKPTVDDACPQYSYFLEYNVVHGYE